MGIRMNMALAMIMAQALTLQAQTPPASQPAPIRASIVINDLLVDGAQIRNEGTLLQAVRFGSADDITAFGIQWSKWPGKPACHCTTEWPKAKEETTIVDGQGKTFAGNEAELMKWTVDTYWGWVNGTCGDLKIGKRYLFQIIVNNSPDNGARGFEVHLGSAVVGADVYKPVVVSFEWVATNTNETWKLSGGFAKPVGMLLHELPDPVKLPTNADVKSLSVIPTPKTCKLAGGNMALTPKSRIVAGKLELMPLAKILATEIEQLVGLKLEASDKAASAGDIELVIAAGLKDEAYALEVGKKATVKAGNAAAVALGSVTLLQSLSPRQGGVVLPRMSVQDVPASSYRGFMVDCVRQPHSINVLKQLVVLCRWYKIRYLQLHLTDAEAFTFPSTAYPQLATKDRHYTLEELRDLEAFSRDRGVTIIPEIDVPGHAKVMVQALPQVFATPAGGYEISVGREETYKALDTIVGEVCDVFRSTPYFHIGGDEVTKNFWGDPETAAYMKAHDLENTEELYRHFIVRMHEIVKKHNKKTLVWEGFGPKGKIQIPKEIMVMAFENLAYLPADLVADGYQVINTAWTPLYVVNRNTTSLEETYGWNLYHFGSIWKQSKAYGKGLDVEPTPQVIGAQMCAWEQTDLLELPSLRHRLAAMSERIWNPDAKRTFADFTERLRATDAGLTLVMP